MSQCLGVSGYSWGSPETFPLLILVSLAICLLTVHDRRTLTGRPFSPYYRDFWGDCNQRGMDRLLALVGVEGVDQDDRGRWFCRVVMVFVLGFPPYFEYSLRYGKDNITCSTPRFRNWRVGSRNGWHTPHIGLGLTVAFRQGWNGPHPCEDCEERFISFEFLL